MLLVLLQNAWSRYYTRIGRPGEVDDDNHFATMRRKIWRRESWLAATWASASGRKLMIILKDIPEDQLWLDDTTLEIADKPSGIKPPDLEHVRSVLRERSIKAVVACGKQAHATIDKVWLGPCIKIPHPAVRVLTNQVLGIYNTEIQEMLNYIEKYRTYRVTLDSHGFQSHGTIQEELNYGSSWIREG